MLQDVPACPWTKAKDRMRRQNFVREATVELSFVQARGIEAEGAGNLN